MKCLQNKRLSGFPHSTEMREVCGCVPLSLSTSAEFSLMKSSILVSALFCGAVTTSLSAAIVSYTDLGLWSEDVAASGASVATETLNNYHGFYAGSITGNTGGIAWTATSPGNFACEEGLVTTNNSNSPITFTFNPGVKSVGGNIFATDWYFEAITARIQVTPTDGSAFVGYSTSAVDFIGFISTGASISSMTLVATKANTDVYATIDNMYLGVVPAPGAVALLGLAGFVSRRRRGRV